MRDAAGAGEVVEADLLDEKPRFFAFTISSASMSEPSDFSSIACSTSRRISLNEKLMSRCGQPKRTPMRAL